MKEINLVYLVTYWSLKELIQVILVFLIVSCFWLFCAPGCSVFLIVPCFWLFRITDWVLRVPDCSMFLNVSCFWFLCVPDCSVFLIVPCSWLLRVSYFSVILMAPRFWLFCVTYCLLFLIAPCSWLVFISNCSVGSFHLVKIPEILFHSCIKKTKIQIIFSYLSLLFWGIFFLFLCLFLTFGAVQRWGSLDHGAVFFLFFATRVESYFLFCLKDGKMWALIVHN